MARSRVTLVTLMWVSGVWFSRISGAEVEMMVTPGDNVTLYSDCVLKTGFRPVWFRNCSHYHQPPLMISACDLKDLTYVCKDLEQITFLGYSFVWNISNKTYDLLVKNVSKSDLGLYNCALFELKITEDEAGKGGVQKAVFDYGNRTTRLSLLKTTSTPSCISWKLLVSVCLVCVLLSSLISSTCVYCICMNRTKGMKNQDERKGHRKMNRKSTKRDKVGEEDDVCYASLDLPSSGQKHLKEKKKRVERSDFSTYSEIKTDRMGAMGGLAD